MTVVTTMSAYAAVLWVVRSSEKLSINIWGRLEPPGTATCGDAILLAPIKLPHQRFGVFWQLTRHCRDAQVTSCFGRPTTFILSFSELLTGKPLCLPCLSTRFTSMDTPFQVTPHYCLLSPIHPIYCWCFNTFSWHDFVSNHLPIIATHGRPKHLTRGSCGLPETARIVGWGVMATGPIVATATHFSSRRHRRACDLNQIWKYLDSCGRAVPTGDSSWWF